MVLSYWNIEREINIRMGKLKGKFTHPTGYQILAKRIKCPNA